MSELAEGTLVLHTGEHSAAPLITTVLAGIQALQRGGVPGLLALTDLLALARDPAHPMPSLSLRLCEETGLVADGRLEPSLAAVVRASFRGSGLDTVFVHPLTGQE